MQFESDTGFIEMILGYPVELDPDVKTFRFDMYNMMN